MNPAAMMMGGAIGQNMAGMMNGMISGINQPTAGMVPPPIPTVVYHVAINGQSAGPFDLAMLSQMASEGKLSKNSLVWKPGMAGWAQAGEVSELQGLFK